MLLSIASSTGVAGSADLAQTSIGASGEYRFWRRDITQSVPSPTFEVARSRRFGVKPTTSPPMRMIAAIIGRRRAYAALVDRSPALLRPFWDCHGRAPASLERRRRRGTMRCHQRRLTTSAAASVVPQRLQKLRAGGLPSPHAPQMRSPGSICLDGGCCTRRFRATGWDGLTGATGPGPAPTFSTRPSSAPTIVEPPVATRRVTAGAGAGGRSRGVATRTAVSVVSAAARAARRFTQLGRRRRRRVARG